MSIRSSVDTDNGLRADSNVCNHHSWRRDVDAGDGSRSHVIGQVTEDHTISQSGAKVAG